MKAIETKYKGYRFRSRLEARWAVFFDALGLKWEYEPEGFELGGGVRYLPDFKVQVECDFNDPPTTRWDWFEIKGRDATPDEISKMRKLVRSQYTGHIGDGGHGAIVCGDPADATVYRFCGCGEPFCNSDPRISRSSVGDWDPTLWWLIPGDPRNTPLLDEAMLAARSARFEFGECGA